MHVKVVLIVAVLLSVSSISSSATTGPTAAPAGGTFSVLMSLWIIRCCYGKQPTPGQFPANVLTRSPCFCAWLVAVVWADRPQNVLQLSLISKISDFCPHGHTCCATAVLMQAAPRMISTQESAVLLLNSMYPPWSSTHASHTQGVCCVAQLPVLPYRC